MITPNNGREAVELSESAAVEAGGFQAQLSHEDPLLRRFKLRVKKWLSAPATAESLCGYQRTLAGVLQPLTVENVQSIAEAASDAGGAVSLQPISCGRNWGFGSKLPATENTFLLDLSKLTRIRSTKLEGHSVEIEPGVTQGALDAWIGKLGRTHFFNVTGAGTTTSVIGNALEKGIGYSGSRQFDLLALEVVLPDGRLLHTDKTSHGDKQAFGMSLGPDLVPLFCQTNFGIVTAARISLFRRPEKMGAVLCRLSSASHLAAAVDTVSNIMAEGLCYGVPHIFNRERIITSFAPFVDEAGLKDLQATTPEWTLLLPIKGSAGVFDAVAAEIALRLEAFGATEVAIGAVDEEAPKLASLLQGRPNDFSLASIAYAAFGSAASPDLAPEETSAGLIHVAPCLPLNGEVVQSGVRLAERILQSHGIRPIAMSLNAISPRAVALVTFISFDRRSAEKTAVAQKAASELLCEFARRGLLPYRLGLNQADTLPKMSETAIEVLSAIQLALDPNQCMAPSRYEILWTASTEQPERKKI